jgi:hypothetical protein
MPEKKHRRKARRSSCEECVLIHRDRTDFAVSTAKSSGARAAANSSGRFPDSERRVGAFPFLCLLSLEMKMFE